MAVERRPSEVDAQRNQQSAAALETLLDRLRQALRDRERTVEVPCRIAGGDLAWRQNAAAVRAAMRCRVEAIAGESGTPPELAVRWMALDGSLMRTADIAADHGLSYEAARRRVAALRDRLAASVAREPLAIGEPCRLDLARREFIVAEVATEAALHTPSPDLADYTLERLRHEMLEHPPPRTTGGARRQQWGRFARRWIGLAQHRFDADGGEVRRFAVDGPPPDRERLRLFDTQRKGGRSVEISDWWQAGLLSADAPAELRLRVLPELRRDLENLADRMFLLEPELSAAEEIDDYEMAADCYVDLAQVLVHAGLHDAAELTLRMAEEVADRLSATLRPTPTFAVSYRRWNRLIVADVRSGQPFPTTTAVERARTQIAGRLIAILRREQSAARFQHALAVGTALLYSESFAFMSGIGERASNAEVLAPIADLIEEGLASPHVDADERVRFWVAASGHAAYAGIDEDFDTAIERWYDELPRLRPVNFARSIADLRSWEAHGRAVGDPPVPPAIPMVGPWRGTRQATGRQEARAPRTSS